MNRLLMLASLALPLPALADNAPQSAPQTPPPAPSRLELSAYFPSWAESADGVPCDQLDQLYYAFLRPTPDGGFEPLGNPDVLKDLVRRAHAAGAKVSIAVGGAQPRVSPAYAAISADAALRAVFIRNLLAFIDDYALDGADIDWEYPVAGVSADHCGLLLQELSAALHPRGKLLSIAVPGNDRISSYPDAIFPVIDTLNVMAYDRGRPRHSTLDYAQAALAYWTGRGCPPGKIMLGVPFYSRSADAEPLAYRKLRALGADPDADLFTTADNHTHGYNGRATLRAKAALARDRGVRGLMIWEIEQDTRGEDSLLLALRAALQPPPPAASSGKAPPPRPETSHPPRPRR